MMKCVSVGFANTLFVRWGIKVLTTKFNVFVASSPKICFPEYSRGFPRAKVVKPIVYKESGEHHFLAVAALANGVKLFFEQLFVVLVNGLYQAIVGIAVAQYAVVLLFHCVWVDNYFK